MLTEIVSWVAVGLIFVTATTMLIINRDWRISLGALALQYTAVFWLVTLHLPFVMGSAKLITGWMVVATMGMTRLGISTTDDDAEEFSLLHGGWYRLILMSIVALVTFGATTRIETIIPGMGLPVIAGGILLIGAGVVHLGVTSDLLRVILALLTVLSGFEILYAAVESSMLVAGFLSVVSLGMGLVGSYLLLAGSSPSETESE
ncbi:MAG: hypothetical protein HZB50_08370 [Chloroflexi bacterium]|nr:hypothetical protein [Chloroflexota bacterium]